MSQKRVVYEPTDPCRPSPVCLFI